MPRGLLLPPCCLVALQKERDWNQVLRGGDLEHWEFKSLTHLIWLSAILFLSLIDVSI